MFGKALYYPNIDVDDAIFLRSTILFYEGLQTIVPGVIASPYQSEDTRICAEQGYLKPLRCELHPSVIRDLAKSIARSSTVAPSVVPLAMRLLDNEWMARRFTIETELSRLHIHKFDPILLEALLRCDTRKFDLKKLRKKLDGASKEALIDDFSDCYERDHSAPEEGEWVLVDSAFASLYMASLAARLARQVDAVPLTNSITEEGRLIGPMVYDETESGAEDATPFLISFAMRGLKIDPSVRVDRLLEFRRSRRDQYEDLADKFRELSREVSAPKEDPERLRSEWLHVEAGKVYREKVLPDLRRLRRELSIRGIESAWEAAFRAVTVTVPSASVFSYYTGLSGQVMLGAGAALAITDVALRSHFGARRIKAQNPYSYLYEAREYFGLPAMDDD